MRGGLLPSSGVRVCGFARRACPLGKPRWALRAAQNGDRDGGGGSPPTEEVLQRRALSVLRGAQEFDWRQYLPDSVARLGGTLVVSDAEHKDVVQQAHQDGTLSFGFSAGGTLVSASFFTALAFS